MPEPRSGLIETSFRRHKSFDFGGVLDRLEQAPDVVIVIPVYNGGEAVAKCIRSVVNHTHGHRIVVIDDHSTDDATLEILGELAALPNVEIRRNEVNLGYTRTANLATRIAAGADLIMLNSDTIVGPMWVERLRWTAYSLHNVGSVSACSDNAGAMAMPTPGVANDWDIELNWTGVARFVAQNVDPRSLETPTAHGFCMYMRRDALDAVGNFDDTSFPRGYGEENDWSMRALAAGLVNLVAPHVFVKHLQGVSFGDARAQLIASARSVVDELHPSYRRLVRQWGQSPEMLAVRDNSADVRSRLPTRPPRPRTLYVLHRSGGGTPETNRDLMEGLSHSQDAFLLEATDRVIQISRWSNGAAHKIAEWRPKEPFSLRDSWRKDYADFLAELLIANSIELVHVRHLMYQPLTTLPLVTKLLGIPMILSTHDFYYICPTVHLLDQNAQFCGGVCTPGEGPCTLPNKFTSGAPNLKHNWIDEWRRRSSVVLDISAHVIATTRSAAQLYATNYPRYADKLRLVEHGRDLSLTWGPLRAGRERRPGPLRVACSANWAVQKGPNFIHEVAALTGSNVEWHMLGGRSEFLGAAAVNHGRYGRDEVRWIYDQIDPDFVGLFSIWPETYSHTLTEAWALGVPVLATNIGAVADRVRDHGGGVLFDIDSPRSVADYLLAKSRDLLTGKFDAGDVPRHSIRSRMTMAEDYSLLYAQTRENLHQPVVGYGLAGAERSSPTPGALRLARRLIAAEPTGIHFKPFNVSDFAHGIDATAYRELIIAASSVGPDESVAFIARCDAMKIPYRIEFEEGRQSLTVDVTTTGHDNDAEEFNSLIELVESAAEVCVESKELATIVRGFTTRVTVIPTVLEENPRQLEGTAR